MPYELRYNQVESIFLGAVGDETIQVIELISTIGGSTVLCI